VAAPPGAVLEYAHDQKSTHDRRALPLLPGETED